MKQVILTGLRANNDLHIGNYLGALLPLIDMAKTRAGEYQVNLFVPDLHSFTTPIDHRQLQSQIMQNLRVFVAAGLPLDHDDVRLYRQSYVPAHSELTWILDCFTGFGEMSRMTQFKDKGGKILPKTDAIALSNRLVNHMMDAGLGAEKFKDIFAIIKNEVYSYAHETKPVSVGLFNYPVLMAADILLYDTTYVPVGEDQTQHVEFARDIAQRLNNQFGELFTIPAAVADQHKFFGKDQGLRIRDLIDPAKKMSKSDETGRGVIFLSDAPETAAKKVMSATTDSFNEIKYDMQERPGISNLLQILALFSGKNLDDVRGQYEGQTTYGEFKKAVAESVKGFLAEFQAKLASVDDAAILAKLERDEAAMRDQAGTVLLKVQKAVGLRS